MMIRQTSIEAYNTIKENGLLSDRRWQVYSALYNISPATGSEIYKEMKRIYGAMMPTNSNTTTRLGELRSLGVVKESGTRRCSVTQQNVILWEVTDKLPIKLDKPKRKKCPHCDGKGYTETQQARLF